jgi:hypothetical protein
MKMNSKTAGIFFLFVCLFIVLFIGQWSNSRGGSNAAYLGQMESFTEGKSARTTLRPRTTIGSIQTTKKPMIVGAPKSGQTTKKSMELFTEGVTARKKRRSK